jgi:hypothetical protein
MMMPPFLRKFALTAHVTVSVGWLGAVAGFLALAIAGLTSPDAQMVQAAYLAMDLTTSLVIVPLCLASLLTGLIQSLGTPWGLFRHYWVVAKLVITLPSTLILLMHTQAIRYMAGAAAERVLASGDLRQLRIQLAADAGAALLALIMTTTLSVYKPRGLTPYGQRRQREQRSPMPDLDRAA